MVILGPQSYNASGNHSGWNKNCLTAITQALALDALAAWLEEDAGRLQPRLAQRDTLARLTALVFAHTPAGRSH